MENSKNNDIDFEKIYSSSSKDFHQREGERAIINEQIQDIVSTIANAELKLNELSVFGVTEQLHLAKAKVELINVLKSIEDKVTLSEKNFRCMLKEK